MSTIEVDGRVREIVAGPHHTCALLDDGAVRCWGDDGPSSVELESAMPLVARTVALTGKVTQLTAGSHGTCAVLADGAVSCWEKTSGGNSYPPSMPEVTSFETPVVRVKAGWYHTCALLEGGSVRCWGVNQKGELGYGSMIDVIGEDARRSVTDVDVGGSAIVLSAGHSKTCVLLDTQDIRCWGDVKAPGLGAIGDDINETPASAGDVSYR